MDSLKVDTILNSSASLVFNPDWKSCIGEIITYMPKVRIGQNVAKNQVLASIETSRMITCIKAPIAGKIENIDRDWLDNPCAMPDGLVLFQFKVPNEMPVV